MNTWSSTHLDRRAVLRCALAAAAGVVAPVALASCTTQQQGPGSPVGAGSPAPPEGGTSMRSIPQELTKRAIVYLPFGYTPDERYDVFYLMHGGWGDETTTLGTADDPSAFKNVLDHAIAAGQIAPLIIVCPTYNNTSADDSANFGLALTLARNYHRELMNDLVPAVEGRYSTHADDVSSRSLAASREHRGFGGFSMGAVNTWRTFQYALDYFRYFLPMSCGTSLDMEDIVASARSRDPADYFVWIVTGSQDFARPYDEATADFLRSSRYFTESDNEQDGNLALRVKDGYGHDEVAATEYTYNGLRWFWRS